MCIEYPYARGKRRLLFRQRPVWTISDRYGKNVTTFVTCGFGRVYSPCKDDEAIENFRPGFKKRFRLFVKKFTSLRGRPVNQSRFMKTTPPPPPRFRTGVNVHVTREITAYSPYACNIQIKCKFTQLRLTTSV